MNKSIIFLALASCIIAQADTSTHIFATIDKLPGNEVTSSTAKNTIEKVSGQMATTTAKTGFAADMATYAQQSVQVAFAGTTVLCLSIAGYQLLKAFESWWKDKKDHELESGEHTGDRMAKAFIAFCGAVISAGLASNNFADLFQSKQYKSVISSTSSNKNSVTRS